MIPLLVQKIHSHHHLYHYQNNLVQIKSRFHLKLDPLHYILEVGIAKLVQDFLLVHKFLNSTLEDYELCPWIFDWFSFKLASVVMLKWNFHQLHPDWYLLPLLALPHIQNFSYFNCYTYCLLKSLNSSDSSNYCTDSSYN